MAKVYNPIGSLSTIKRKLHENNIAGFASIKELQRFQIDYARSRELLVKNQEALIASERNKIQSEILELENEIAQEKQALRQKVQTEIEQLRNEYDALAEAKKTILQEFTYSFKALFKLLKINYIESFADISISKALQPRNAMLDIKREHLQELILRPWASKAQHELFEFDRKKRVIDELNTFMYGAIGEQKVVAELERLPNDFTLINDFRFSFDKPLFSKQHGYIYSIQIDHLLVSTAGIFLIETKNWSKESIEDINLRSPVEQVTRAGYALNRLLHDQASAYLKSHHWGERKIPIRNLIAVINNKPNEEFQYVKILTLEELRGYVQYFKPALSKEEVHDIVDYLISTNEAD